MISGTYRRHNHNKWESDGDKFGFGLFFAILIIVCGFIVASAIVDGSGRDSEQHNTPVPADVSQIDGKTYIIKDGGNTAPNDICADDYGVDEVRNVSRVDGTFVVCNTWQTWNVNEPMSRNLAHAFTIVGPHPVFIGLSLLTLLICMTPFLVDLRKVRKHNKKMDKAEKAAQEQRKVTLKEKNAIIDELWGRGKLTDLEWETKKQELVALEHSSDPIL